MGGPLSPLLANIYVEYVETLAIDTYFLNPKFWGRYMDDVLAICNNGQSQIEGFLEHLNNLEEELVFTIENETENKLPFLDIWIHRNNNELAFSIYRKLTNNNRYLSFASNHPIKQFVVTNCSKERPGSIVNETLKKRNFYISRYIKKIRFLC